ncbi:10468_t:CDS:2, partial [Dentiscutata erythropus]
ILKKDDQNSINNSSVMPLLESTSSEPKQVQNHKNQIVPKFPPIVDMIEPISKNSRENELHLQMTIVSSMTSQSYESADEIIEYRRIAKEALEKPLRRKKHSLKELNVKMFNFSHFEELKHVGSGGYANVYSAKLNGQRYALKSLRNTLRLEHKEAISFIHE